MHFCKADLKYIGLQNFFNKKKKRQTQIFSHEKIQKYKIKEVIIII